MSYQSLKKLSLSMLMLAATFALHSSDAFAYTLDAANRTITIAPGSSNDATTKDFRDALTYLTNRSDKSSRWTFRFKPGKYVLTSQTATSNLQNVDFVSDPSNPAIIQKASNWSSSTGEFLMFNKFSRSITMSGFTFYGLTSFSSNANPVWPDQGIYFGSVDGLTMERNKFYNFGNAAFRVATYEQDPVKNVNSKNIRVSNNLFENIYQISTTSNDYVHGGAAYYTFENNTINKVHGSVKFASRTPGAEKVKVLNNTINGGEVYGLEIDNYNDFEIRGNTIKNIKSVAINIYTNARAQIDFNWGNNFTIADNNLENNGRGIRFSPDPYQSGYKPVPKNLVIDNNTLTKITDGSNPAISIINGKVEGVKILSNKFNQITSKKYISVSSESTSVSQLNNMVDGIAYGPQDSSAPSPTPGGTTPATPTSLAGNFKDGKINLTWKDNASNETSQEIAYSKDGTNYQLLVKLGSNVTNYTYTIDPAATGTRYYTIRALNSSGASAASQVASIPLVVSSPEPAPDTGTPATPTNLAGNFKDGKINLTWKDNASNETSQEIAYSKDGTNYQLLVKLGANATNYTYTIDPSATGTRYYTIRALNSSGASSASQVASIPLTVASEPVPSPVDTTVKPAAPSNLVGQATSSSSVKLTWTDNANNETSQQLWVSKDGSDYTQLASLGANVTSYTHNNASGSVLYYTIRAVNAIGASTFSPSVKVAMSGASDPVVNEPAPDTGTPATPTSLAGNFKDGKINLTWKDNASNETSQEIAYSKDGTNYQLLVKLGANATNYTYTIDPSATGTRYYTIRALNTNGASTPSQVASIPLTIASEPVPSPVDSTVKPAAPSDLTGQAASSSSVKLTWTDNANNETSQQIWVSKDGSDYSLLAKLGANVTSYTHNNASGSVLYYTIRAVNVVGVSGFCPSAKVALSGTSPMASN